MHKWAAVKSPLGAQTVLGDRQDSIVRRSITNSVGACGTRSRELSTAGLANECATESSHGYSRGTGINHFVVV